MLSRGLFCIKIAIRCIFHPVQKYNAGVNMRAAGIVLLAIIAAATSATAVDAYRSRWAAETKIEQLEARVTSLEVKQRACTELAEAVVDAMKDTQ